MKNSVELDYLIVGAGPAGLQLAYYLEKANRSYLILEGGNRAGVFFEKFPRHRKLISINKVHTGYTDPEVNLRHDWNSLLCDNQVLSFKKYSTEYFPNADHFVEYLNEFAQLYKLKIAYNTRVMTVSKDGGFIIEDDANKKYYAKRLIMCTGVSKPYIPDDIPGIELTDNYTDMSLDTEEFNNKDVLVIGKSNSAFETADHIIGSAALIHVISPTPVKFAWKTHFVGHLRAVNNNFIDTYLLKSRNAILDATINKIEKVGNKYHVIMTYLHNGEQEMIAYDRILSCTGFRFDNSMFSKTCRPKMRINERFPDMTSKWESSNVKGLYFAGTTTQVLDFKKTTSGFIHGFRYNVRGLYRMLMQTYHKEAWPVETITMTSNNITEFLISRINKTSGLWQQFGFLCDLMVLKPSKSEVNYFEEFPVKYVSEKLLNKHQYHLILTFEYGSNEIDAFNAPRVLQADYSNSDQSNFLHPILRYYQDEKMISEHHVMENLEGEWFRDEYVSPLFEYVQKILAQFTNNNCINEAKKMSYDEALIE